MKRFLALIIVAVFFSCCKYEKPHTLLKKKYFPDEITVKNLNSLRIQGDWNFQDNDHSRYYTVFRDYNKYADENMITIVKFTKNHYFNRLYIAKFDNKYKAFFYRSENRSSLEYLLPYHIETNVSRNLFLKYYPFKKDKLESIRTIHLKNCTIDFSKNVLDLDFFNSIEYTLE